MKRHIEGVGRKTVRRLNRVAPRLVDFAAYILSDEVKHKNATDVRMSAGDVHFTMSLPSGRLPKWADYHKLSNSGEPYEPVMLACLTRFLKGAPNPRFMDIGAYLGYYASYAAALLGNGRDVYAVESNPHYADMIRKSASANGFPKLRVFETALSDRTEPVRIEGRSVHLAPAGAWGTRMAQTCDDLCEREQISPNIIKMDVDGAEGKVIFGMPKTLTKVDCILLELHNLASLNHFSPGVTRTALLDALEDAGMKLYYVAGLSHRTDRAFEPTFKQLLAGGSISYRQLGRNVRDSLLFDRRENEFILGLRHDDIDLVLGPSHVDSNA